MVELCIIHTLSPTHPTSLTEKLLHEKSASAFDPEKWADLLYSILKSATDEHGGLVTILAVSLVLSFILNVLIVGGAWKLISRKQKEIDRMARDKQKLEDQVVKRRLSTTKGQRP